MKHTDRITLRQLRCFVTVAEELHFRRAAERLNMSQPPLTQRIQDLERDFGVQLFRRMGPRIELTDAGRMVLKSARDTLAQADNFCEMAQRAAQGQYGQIRVGLTLTALLFAPIHRAIRTFQQEHPGVSLDLTHIISGPALDALKQGKRDVCLIREFPVPLPPDFEQVVIARDRMMLVLPAGHDQARAKRVPLGTMADDNFISLESKRGTAINPQVMRLWERSGLEPHMAQEAENATAAMTLVAGGLGYTILPSSFQTIRLEQVVWNGIDVDDRWTESSLNLVYRKDALAEQGLAGFIHCVQRHACVDDIVRKF